MPGAFFDYEKATQALLYVVVELKNPGFHQTFKVLYFAEREYLREWGNTLLGDNFVKMTDGPVPSFTYNMVKAAANRDHGHSLSKEAVAYAKEHIGVDGRNLYALQRPDLNYLAETERVCLDHAIELCKNVGYGGIREMSHDTAWQSAEMKKPLDSLRIAEAGGADEIALSFLKESLSNNNYRSL